MWSSCCSHLKPTISIASNSQRVSSPQNKNNNRHHPPHHHHKYATPMTQPPSRAPILQTHISSTAQRAREHAVRTALFCGLEAMSEVSAREWGMGSVYCRRVKNVRACSMRVDLGRGVAAEGGGEMRVADGRGGDSGGLGLVWIEVRGRLDVGMSETV
ncbi:hypothetical protein BDR22DRAFT_546823 [Usnea florida]